MAVGSDRQARLTVPFACTLALPYGSYKIYKSTVLGLLTTAVGASDMTVSGNGGATSSGGNNVAVIDPRVP